MLFLTLLVISGLAADTLTVKLKNGTVYTGVLSFENSSMCIISQNNMSHAVRKMDIVTVNDKGYTEGTELKTYTAIQISATESVLHATPAVQDTVAVDYRGKKLSITLKNGMVFNGTVISDKGKMLLLDRDGAPVNLYKSTIARIEIEGESEGKNEKSGSAQIEKNTPQNVVSRDLSVSVSRFEDEPRFPADSSGAEVSESAKKSQPQKATGNNFIQEPVAKVPATRTGTTDVKSADRADNTAGSEKSTVSVNPQEQSTEAVQAPHIPENVYIPSVVKPGNEKRTIVLKNGTVFTGVVRSENERFIIIDSDGTSLNILKKVIKTVDGKVYKSTISAKKTVVPTIRKKVGSGIQKSTFSGKRPCPAVSVPSEMTADILLDSLKSPVWEQRSRACRMLGAMGDWAYSAVPVIAKILVDTAQSRMFVPVWIDSSDVHRLLAPSLEAARTLACLGENGYRALKDGLSSTNVLVRRSAVFGLLEFTGDKTKTEVLFRMLKDRDASVRAVALGGFCTESGEQLLIGALRDSEAAVRCNAALLLGKMRCERAAGDLEILLSDNRSFVRANAVEALGEIGSVRSSVKIIKLLEDPNFTVREKSALALGYIGDTVAIIPLINAFRDVNPDVRGAAATALSYIRDPRAIPSLYSLLKDENSAVREKARNSLRLHTELKQLIDGLNDQSETVRENSSYVLWLLTGKDFGSDPEKWKKWYAEQRKKKLHGR